MPPTTISLTCPACFTTRDVPLEKIPPGVDRATCRTCGHTFPFSGRPMPEESSPDDEFEFVQVEPPPAPPEPARPPEQSLPVHGSSFVTVLAWISIFICGFTTLISILQNVMVYTVFPVEQFRELPKGPDVPEIPELFRFVFENIRLWFTAVLVLSAGMLGVSIGLLKRKEWARRLFIGFLGLGIVWNLGGIVLQISFMRKIPKPVQAPPEFVAGMETFQTIIVAFSAVMAIGMAVLLGWLIKRLVSPDIRKEFAQCRIGV